MEYTAEIVKEIRIKDKLLLKYFFRNIKTDEIDWFLSDRKIFYVPSLKGKLILKESDDHPKFYQSFKQDVNNLTDEEEERLFKSENETNQEVEKLKNDPTKKERKPLTTREITFLEQKDWTQKEISEFAFYLFIFVWIYATRKFQFLFLFWRNFYFFIPTHVNIKDIIKSTD